MKLNEDFEKTVTSESIERWRYPRFFTRAFDGGKAYVSGTDADHIRKVLRMKAGDIATICDCAGYEYICRLEGYEDGAAEFRIMEKRRCDSEPDVYLRLFQCLPKSDKMDFIIQKAVELGASEIIPVLSSRCVSRPDGAAADKKQIRWQRIADEAAKQCGRGILPAVGELIPFDKAVQYAIRSGMKMIFYECGGETMKNILDAAGSKPSGIDIFIGPEGGFEKYETDLAVSAGIRTATLGKRILRCETAPVAAIAVLMNLTGNL